MDNYCTCSACYSFSKSNVLVREREGERTRVYRVVGIDPNIIRFIFFINSKIFEMRHLRAIPRINRTTVKGGPDNCKSVSDPNQTYMVDTSMDPNHKNGEIRLRPQKWAGLDGGRS